MQSILQIKDLEYFRAETQILHQINISIEKQSVYCLLGENGAGKTTIIKLILGLLKPHKGFIRILDKDLSATNRLQLLEKIGSLIESASLYSHLTVFENVEQSRRIYQLEKKDSLRVLEIVGLGANKDKKVSSLSMGMKQRLGIALAIINKPELVVLDEPTNSLDPQGIIDLRNLILSLNQNKGITFFISTHLLSEAEKLATHVGILHKGKLVLQDSIQHLQAQSLENLYINSTNS
jgi:lantibiotic transport system ATP-binding protein